ncbi:S24 family peptidase [Rhodopseudomonas sp. BR0G17]|uniref:LexA family protein n=1 Tax=Rhodopseudomonas sp. BR0G17 TaxID=2269368 RepID=UPI0013E06D09|nr:S24 family peptidase [Rhodopseudomonas sp. BR0G17]
MEKLIRDTRLALGSKGKPLSQTRFGELVGVSQVGVSRWESGEDAPTEKNLLKLIEIEPAFAKFLPSRAINLPVYTMVSAGALSAAETVLDAHLDELRRIPVAGLRNGDYFILQVEGDSMNKIAPDTSFIVVDRADRELVPGKDYIFMHDGRATFKRYRARPMRLEPYSHNPEHDPIELDGLEGVSVVGRVVKVFLDL